MKQLIVLLMAAGIMASCNNNGPKNDGGGGLFGGGGKNNNNNNNNAKGWTTADRNKFMNDCNNGMAQQQNAQQICSCVLEKMEKQYTSLEEADRVGGAAAGEKAARECLANTGGANNNDYNDDGGNRPNNGGDDGYAKNNGGGMNWTAQEKQTFISQCTPAAQQAQGLSQQQATSYCECMTNKVAAKFSYADANRLTEIEFQKPEWQQAMMDCRPGADY